MIISYHGGEAFRLQFGDTVIALNPPGKKSALKGSRFGADIALVSLNHTDMNGADTIGIGDRQPVVIAGPGEYEVKGVFVKGFAGVSHYGGEERINTIYMIALEGMNICYLGALDSAELPADLREAAENVDVLIVPVGGDGVLSPADAAKVAVAIEPAIVIPMHYGDIGSAGALKQFLKEQGEENVAALEKLTVKKKDLEGKEGEVVILSSAS
jgi:L-ascorbate metabolism protein UlaG (beta-lactamase superfamily)